MIFLLVDNIKLITLKIKHVIYTKITCTLRYSHPYGKLTFQIT